MAQYGTTHSTEPNAWREYNTVVAVRTNPALQGQVELVVQDVAGKRATIRVQGAVLASN